VPCSLALTADPSKVPCNRTDSDRWYESCRSSAADSSQITIKQTICFLRCNCSFRTCSTESAVRPCRWISSPRHGTDALTLLPFILSWTNFKKNRKKGAVLLLG
jgi:hypothetical protein